MNGEQPKNPLHGVTLGSVVVQLVDHYGWDELATRIKIQCFKSDPSVKSSLHFLRENTLGQRESGASVSLHLRLFGASQTKTQALIVPTLERWHDQRLSEAKQHHCF